MTNNRRSFLKKIGAAGTVAGVSSLTPLLANALPSEMTNSNTAFEKDKTYTLDILQTTDVHCQVHPHDELFWENDKAVFRRTGGYPQMATYFKKARKSNPDTFIIDTGDMFQGCLLYTSRCV